MSRWTNNLDSQQALQKIRGTLDSLRKGKTEAFSLAHREEYERAVKVLTLLDARISTLDPELFSGNAWGNVQPWLNNIKNQADSFATNSNPGHLTALNAGLDDMLSLLRPLDSKLSEHEVKALTDALSLFQRQIVTELDVVKQKSEDVKKQYESLLKEIADGKVRLQKNDAIIEAQKARLDTSISEFQKQFSTAQDTRSQDFLKALGDIKSNYQTEMQGIAQSFVTASEAQKKEWESLIGKTTKESTSHLDFLQKRKKEVDDIFGAIGSAALAGNFNNIANTEGTFANTWRRIAFGFFCAMGVVAVLTFSLTFKGTPDWETFVFRLGTVIVLSVPAFYAANESSKHRDREKLIRKNFLELSAIDAYLVHLPEKERNEIKGKLSEKFFGVPEVHEKGEHVTKKDVFGLVEKVVKELSKGH